MTFKQTREDSEAWHLTDDLHAEQGKGDPFAAAMRATRMSMLITDPRQPDNPIVFVNEAFSRLTGYSREEIVGRNCRFLQGSETDPESIEKIRDAVATQSDISIDILNYRKDGSKFWNALFMSPVSNQSGDLQFFFASQVDATERKRSENRVIAEKDGFEEAVKERTHELELALEAKTALLHEVDHRVKNNLQMISSLIIMQSRSIPDDNIRKSLRAMLERVEALSTVHRRLYQSDDVTRFDVPEFIRDLVGDLVGDLASPKISAGFDLEPIEVPAEKAAPIALMVNELVTNSIKHAFPENRTGRIDVSVKRVDGHFRVSILDNGVGMNGASGNKSFGLGLINSLSRQLQAKVEWEEAAPGTHVTIKLPIEQRMRGE